MSGVIRVTNPGALSLVQDAGRIGYQRYGVSVSGAMDADALFIGNLLVNNEEGSAAIEVTFGGAQFVFEQETVAAITGADLGATLNGMPFMPWESFMAPAGSTLAFSAPVSGLRAYLSVAGGIGTEPVLGSRSTHTGSALGGLAGKALAANDEVPIGEPSPGAHPGLSLPAELRPEFGMDMSVRVIPGPQDDAFTDAGIETFFSSAYTVIDKSDRQGVRLEGPVIEARDGRYDIVSDAATVGAIQVPGDGMPIALLADRQTTGGYAKIAVIATVDLPKLAQAIPGASVRFERVSADEARDALIQRRNALLAVDLRSEWREEIFDLAIDALPVSVKLSYRPGGLREPGGTTVVAHVNGSRALAHVRCKDSG